MAVLRGSESLFVKQVLVLRERKRERELRDDWCVCRGSDSGRGVRLPPWPGLPGLPTLCTYAAAMHYPVLTSRMALVCNLAPPRPSTDVCYRRSIWYCQMPGTDVAYGAARSSTMCSTSLALATFSAS
eukprot:891570-Rhodomonas_salina.1